MEVEVGDDGIAWDRVSDDRGERCVFAQGDMGR